MVVAPPVVAVDVSASPLVVVQRVVVPPRSSGASKKPLPELLLCLTTLASLCLSVADPAMTSFVAFLLPLDRLVESREASAATSDRRPRNSSKIPSQTDR